MNPLFGNNSNNIFGMLKNIGNPQAMIQSLMMQNPQFKQFADSMQGKDAEQMFYQECQKRGVNPQDALNQVNQFIR